jgi:hypothetical protein
MTIRVTTSVRVMPAFWFGPAICLLAVVYVTSLPPVDRYALAASASGSAALPFVAAFVGAAAAWEGGRLRRGRTWGGPWRRSMFAIAVWPIGVSVGFGIVAVLAAIALQLVRSDANAPDIRIAVVTLADLVAWGTVGFALGVRLPMAAATPVALLLPYLWLGFVPALNPVWLRHITGLFRDCCTAGEDLSPGAAIASLLVSAAFTIAAWTVTVAPPGRVRVHLLIATITSASAVAAATLLVSGLGFAPVVARDPSLLSCRQLEEAELCLWPEHLDRIDVFAAVTSASLDGWRAAGIPTPALVTEADRSRTPPGALVVSFADVHQRDAGILALAHGALPPRPDCPSAIPGIVSATTGGEVAPFLEAWFASAGGLSATAISAVYDEVEPINENSVSTIVEELRTARTEERERWISRLRAQLTTCDQVEPDVSVSP